MVAITRRVATTLSLLLLAFAITLPDAVAQGAKKLTVELDWAPTGMHAGLHLAQQKGWFDDAGIEVEIVDGKGSTGTIQHIAAGQFDVGFVHLGTMAAGVSKGMPIISIACIMRASDFGLMVPADSGWTSLQDLRGKKIALAAAAGVAAFFDPYLRASNMTRSDVEVISVDTSALISTYTTGAADAAISATAFFIPIVNNMRRSTHILMSDVGLNVPGYGFIVRKDDVDTNANALRTFVEVNQRAWNYILAGNEEEAVDAILAQRSGLRLDRDIILGQLEAHIPFFDTPSSRGHPIGWQAESDWIQAIKAMQDVGMVEGDLEPHDVFTNELISSN